MYHLLTTKGKNLYENYSSTSRPRKEKLPPIEVFYDSLHDRQCTTANYRFTIKVWVKGGSKNEVDYCKIYQASDVLMFLDIVCNNTESFTSKIGLDLDFYLSILIWSWI